jgi:hypothetical protein
MAVLLSRKKLGVIEQEATARSLAQIAAFLQEKLGQKFTAYLSGLNDPKEVCAWARGEVKPRDTAAMRLRYAYRAVRMILETYDSDTAKAWLFGANTRLDDKAPAYLLRHSDTIDELMPLIPVSRAFAGSAD